MSFRNVYFENTFGSLFVKCRPFYLFVRSFWKPNLILPLYPQGMSCHVFEERNSPNLKKRKTKTPKLAGGGVKCLSPIRNTWSVGQQKSTAEKSFMGTNLWKVKVKTKHTTLGWWMYPPGNLTYPPDKAYWKMIFLFPQVGYANFLGGRFCF